MKVGDFVEVTDSDRIFILMAHWQGLVGFENIWTRSKTVNNGECGTILSLAGHNTNLRRMVALVNFNKANKVIMIGTTGLRVMVNFELDATQSDEPEITETEIDPFEEAMGVCR